MIESAEYWKARWESARELAESERARAEKAEADLEESLSINKSLVSTIEAVAGERDAVVSSLARVADEASIEASCRTHSEFAILLGARELESAEDAAERIVRSLDEYKKFSEDLEDCIDRVFVKLVKTRAWARRWKRAATHYRDKHLNALTRIGHVKALASGRIRALEARLEKWRTAERMTTYSTSTGTFRIPGDAVIWSRVPPLEE